MRSAVGALLILVLVPPVSADRFSETVRDHAVIQDGEGSARVLFKLRAPDDLGTVAVSRTSATFSVSGTIEARTLRLRVYPVTRSWDAQTVSWNGDWREPGGDFDPDVYSVVDVDLARGAHSLSLDLTAMVKEALEHGSGTHGFLVTTDPAVRIGINTADLPRLVGLGDGTIEVSYRQIRPRARRAG